MRIGLQRARGEDLPEALRVAAAYPSEWQPALFEELGWRAGEDRWDDFDALLAQVPQEARCAFVQGAARGRVIRSPWTTTEAADAQVEELALRGAECQTSAWRGVAWGLLLTWEHSAGGPEQRASQLSEGPARDGVLLSLEQLQTGPRGQPWQP